MLFTHTHIIIQSYKLQYAFWDDFVPSFSCYKIARQVCDGFSVGCGTWVLSEHNIQFIAISRRLLMRYELLRFEVIRIVYSTICTFNW